MSRQKSSAAECFWARVNRGGDDECWLWTGPMRGYGYGGFYINCRGFYAHRWIYEHHYGVDPGRLCVLHRCDVRLCVNPAHLFLGSHTDNMADMKAKGRGGDRRNFGGRNGRAKLTALQVQAIREQWAAGISQKRLAREFGVSQPNIGEIVHGRTWTCVS